jgi:DEAD/DEAH box helicase domain-containing protein
MHTIAAMGLMCDPRDLGETLGERVGEGELPQKGNNADGAGFDPTIFLYDHVPGGIGLATRLFEDRETILRRTRELIESCACDRGCPACIGAGESMVPQPTTKPTDLTTLHAQLEAQRVAAAFNLKKVATDLFDRIGVLRLQ